MAPGAIAIANAREHRRRSQALRSLLAPDPRATALDCECSLPGCRRTVHGWRDPRQIYCSAACAKEAHRARARAAYERTRPLLRNCEECLRPCLMPFGRQRYCSAACLGAARRRRAREERALDATKETAA